MKNVILTYSKHALNKYSNAGYPTYTHTHTHTHTHTQIYIHSYIHDT